MPVENLSKLDELAEKSSQKNSGNVAGYISANQALRDDLRMIFKELMQPMIEKISIMEESLQRCENELKQSSEREKKLLQRIQAMEKENINKTDKTDISADKDHFHILGTSLLREVYTDDILNGTVNSISGVLVKDIRDVIQKLENTPKNLIIQVGGNDLTKEESNVESVSSEYAVLLAEVKAKFPNVKIIVSGLPPRFTNEEIRFRVKEFNEAIKKWASENSIQYIDNEIPFELKSGDIDTSVYIMSGDFPGIHLNRRGTLRWLDNISKALPNLKLNERKENTPSKFEPSRRKSFAEAVKNEKGRTPRETQRQTSMKKRIVDVIIALKRTILWQNVGFQKKLDAITAKN